MPRPHTAPLAGLLAAAATVTSLAAPAQALRTTEDWTLEISIVDRRGHSVGSNVFIGPQDAKTAASAFRMCRASTVPGKSGSARS
jgi:hypothetical protein